MQMPGRKEEGKVPLNMDSMSKCMCGTCPVQAQSTCARPKIEMAKENSSRLSRDEPRNDENYGSRPDA